MNYPILAIALILSTPYDHTEDICFELSKYQGNVIYRTIDLHNLKMMQGFNKFGHYIATTENIYIGNRNEVIESFRRDYCPGNFL